MNRFSLARAMENHFRAVKTNYLAVLVDISRRPRIVKGGHVLLCQWIFLHSMYHYRQIDNTDISF